MTADVKRELLIRCPTTQELVSTGRAYDEESFASAQAAGSARCSACGVIHSWSKKDVAPETWAKVN